MKSGFLQRGIGKRLWGKLFLWGDEMLPWYFWIYSFLGYLLEKLFAKATRARQQGRKCFLLLPLCPVYGLSMLAVLALPTERSGWLSSILWGGFAATAVEYAVHWGYEALFNVRFWDYSDVRGNLHGRVCLPFSVAWGVLTALAVRLVQPAVVRLAARTIPEVTWLCLMAFTVDALLSAKRLWLTGDGEALRADRRGLSTGG